MTTPTTHDSPGVRLSTKLPKASDANGLQPIANALLDEPRELRYAVIAYDVARLIDEAAQTRSGTASLFDNEDGDT